MDTYFIRHTEKLDLDAATRQKLWNKRTIAIHFPYDKSGQVPDHDNSSLDPDDYSGSARRAMRTLLELAEKGGYVCADYYGHDECILGRVSPNSEVELVRGVWGNRHNRSSREAIMKCLSLEKTRLVKLSDVALILVGRPRQGTIMRWPRARRTIENLVEGRQVEPSLELLSPDQQEIMCSEYLRLADAELLGLSRLAHLLLPVGRNMKDIDIYGMTGSGKKVFAQVTYLLLEQCKAKLTALQGYGDNGRNVLILFCDCSEPRNEGDVIVVPLRHVYEQFAATPAGRAWLQHAINPLSPSDDLLAESRQLLPTN